MQATTKSGYGCESRGYHYSDCNELYNLGKRYDQDNGVEKDITKAIECWRKAAEQRHADAIKRLEELK